MGRYQTKVPTVNIIMFDQSSAFAEYVHASLVPVVDFVLPNRRIAVRRYPHAGEIIRMDSIIDKLT